MILTLDVGNSQILGGLFENEKILLRFRKSTSSAGSSDELGLFLRTVIREHGFDPGRVKHIAMCSVVPDLVYSATNACRKYFDCEPFLLGPGVKTGLKIRYKNPVEVGADRIANAIAGTHLFPNKNLIIADFGTASTLCAVSKDRDYIGGVIVPGLRLSMEALEKNTAKLPKVEISQPAEVVGRSTVESIQSGLFYGHYFMMKGLFEHTKKEIFHDEETLVIGTGGFARMFEKSKLFDSHIPDLVLIGLFQALKMSL